jgi:hypothetical protein
MGPEASIFRFLTVAALFFAINKLYPAKATPGKAALAGAASHQ